MDRPPRMTRSFAALGKSLRLRGLAAKLERACADAPVPDLARSLAPGVLAASRGDALSRAWQASPGRVCEVVGNLCGGAPFLVPTLERHSGWVASLATDDLAVERSADDYRRRLGDVFATAAADRTAAATLRAFKYYELSRITVRDLSSDLVPLERTNEILAELSHLADALLDRALACARSWAERASTGSPPPVRFAVIGMGKLGSEELNYSSDVDLIYVCEDPAENRGGIDPVEYTSSIAQDFGHLVRRKTGDGFLYRVDLDLRPEGKAGPLVVTGSTLADYYERWSETWEKAAFMKARPVAGDLDFGWQVIRSIDPIVYRSTMDLGAIEAIRTMKDKIEQAAGREDRWFNLKLGKGGIRDVEFVAQALQLVHGGRRPQVRQRSTQASLEALKQAGALDPEPCDALLAGYRFLRRTENRIQMEHERQVYRLPAAGAGRLRVARSLGFREGDSVAAFDQQLSEHRARIHEVFGNLFEMRGGEQILDLFQRNAPSLLANPAGRSLVENLARQIAESVATSASPERAMNNVEKFIRGVGSRRFFYELLLDRPELVPRLVRLFAASEYLSTYVATHPRLIEPLFDDPEVLLHSRSELAASFKNIREMLEADGTRVEPELSLDSSRLFHNSELVNVGLLDMDGRVDRADAERSLTDIAEVCVEEGLALAEREVVRRGKKRPAWMRYGEFLVVAMGKMASREITYGSDLDVIFLYDLPGGDDEAQLGAQGGFAGLAQKFIWALQTRTEEGVCYEIDARLRPSGNQGLLVSHIDTFAAYHDRSAAPWERQALLRARPVGGSARLAELFDRLRREILRRENPADLRREIHRVRTRMEAELAQESTERRDFKTGKGGLLDVETVVQCLQLEHAGEHERLIEPRTIAEQIALLADLSILDAADAAVLAGGWEFLQRLSSRLRIVENRSISDLSVERGDLDDVAKRLGYRSAGRSSGARRALLDEYQRRTSEIRSVYSSVLGIAEPGAAPAPPVAPRERAKPRSGRKLRARTALGRRQIRK